MEFRKPLPQAPDYRGLWFDSLHDDAAQIDRADMISNPGHSVQAPVDQDRVILRLTASGQRGRAIGWCQQISSARSVGPVDAIGDDLASFVDEESLHEENLIAQRLIRIQQVI